MAKYLYSGVRQGVSLATGTQTVEGVEQSTFEDFDLVPGSEIDLPADNAVVKTMVAAKLLQPIEGGNAPTKRAKSTGGASNA